MLYELTADECDLVRALEDGVTFNPRNMDMSASGSSRSAPPTDAAPTIVRAEALERMLRGLTVASMSAEPLRVEEPRLVHIVGVTIEGDLNLQDLRGLANEFAPPILLECCRFTGKLDLRYSSIARLSLQGSRLRELELDSCQIRGNLDLRDIAAAGHASDDDNPLFHPEIFKFEGDETPGFDQPPVLRGHRLAQCWIRAKNCHVGGDLLGRGAKLCCPMRRDDAYAEGGIPYALDLGGARIDGTLVLQPDVVMMGGMSLAECKVGGSVWMGGAMVRAVNSDVAIRCQSAELGEHFQLRAVRTSAGILQPFCCIGRVDLMSARVKGEVRVAGGAIHQPARLFQTPNDTGDGWSEQGYLFNLWLARLGGLRIGSEQDGKDVYSVVVHGGVYAQGTELDTSFIIDPGVILGPAKEDTDALADWCRPFTVEANDARAPGNIDLTNASIGAELALSGKTNGGIFGVRLTVNGGATLTGNAQAINLLEATIGKGLELGSFAANPMHIAEAITLRSAKIGAPMRVASLQVGSDAKATGIVFDCEDLEVDGGLDITCRVWGGLSLAGAEVHGNLTMRPGTQVTSRDAATAINCEAIRVRADLCLTCIADGGLNLARARVEGELKLLAGTRILPGKDRKRLALQSEGMQIDGNVELLCEVNGGVSMARSRIDGELRLGRHPKSSDSSGSLALIWDKSTSDAGYMFDLSEIDIRQSLQVGQLDVLPTADVRQEAELRLVRMARGTPLSFYPGWTFVDVHVDRITEEGNRLHGVAAYLVRPLEGGDSSVVVLDGKSPPIHRHNATAAGPHDSTRPLRLDTVEQAADYLRFFCRMVWGEEGAFKTIERVEDLPVGAKLEEGFRPAPITGQRVDDDFRFDDVAVLYGGYLFRASFVVKPTGMVEMLGDKPEANFSAYPRDRYADGLRLPPLGAQGVRIENVKAGKADSLPNASFDYGSAEIDAALRRHVTAWEQPSPPRPFEVNLIGLRAASLDDGDGKGWWRGWRQPAPEDDSEERRHWLGWQPIRTWSQLHDEERMPLIRLRLDGIRFGRTDRWPEVPADNKPDTTEAGTQAGLRIGFGQAAQPGSGGSGRLDELGENHPEKTLQRRKRWLMLQYSDKLYDKKQQAKARPGKRQMALLNLDDYNPQPYEELARALFAEGQFTNARDILIFRSDMDNWLHVSNGIRRPGLLHKLVALLRFLVMWPFSKAFAYGLKPSRSLGAFALCILLGWVGILLALKTDAMVVETTPIAIASRQTDSTGLGMVLLSATTAAGMIESIDPLQCGNEVDPLLYAFDVFVPLLDLRQETQCRMSDTLFWWNLAKSLYAALGWIVTSITVLAVTGVLRLRAQD